MGRVLVIDDDMLVRNSLSRCIADMGHQVLLAGSLAEGLEHAEAGVDVVYLDLNLPDGDGQHAIDALAASAGRPEIVVITGLGNNYGAQGTLARGAWDYITKPASPRLIRESLTAALEYRRERVAPAATRPFDPCGIVGDGPAMRRARQMLERAAHTDAGVLVLGETGVGKELAAKAIHANSRRADGPFVVVDCSNLTETLVESVLYGHVKGAFTGAHADRRGLVAEAHGGTLFLDEVGELPPALQKSFLRVLQEHRFRPVGAGREQSSDFRLVAATNRDLEGMARDGRFRPDLLFRLRTVEVRLPPLRERGDDVALLAAHLAGQACRRYGLAPKTLSPALMRALTGHHWPGNVRELGNVMEAAVIEAGADPVIHPKHLPGQLRMAVLGGATDGVPGTGTGEAGEAEWPGHDAMRTYEAGSAHDDGWPDAWSDDVIPGARVWTPRRGTDDPGRGWSGHEDDPLMPYAPPMPYGPHTPQGLPRDTAPCMPETGDAFPTGNRQPEHAHPFAPEFTPEITQGTPAQPRGTPRPGMHEGHEGYAGHAGHAGYVGRGGREGQPQPRTASPAPRAPKQDAASWNGMPYHDYKAVRDRAYFQHLLDVCEGDVVRASQLSGLSIASVYRHLALAGIATRTRAKR
ncbi:MAG TPA: sigma 54-interacting transcriptional regulator [Nitratidesulfovibrio sp.]|nr:sigma 54-interacting transcriptional regulator [Nitratidesulfovibrio sp.]